MSAESTDIALINSLGSISKRFASIHDVDTLAQTVHEILSSIVELEYAGLYLHDPQTKQFRLVMAHGFTEEERINAERTAMARHPGLVYRTAQVLHIPDVEADTEQRSSSSARSFVVRSRLWLPVMSNEDCVGALGFGSAKKDSFTELHISMLRFVSNMAGLIYRNIVQTSLLKKARDHAEEADRAKGEFLANISHELRTPMSGVVGMAELMLDTSLSEQQRQFTQVIRSSGRSLLVLVDDLLDYSRIEAGQLSLELADFDLEEMLGEVNDLLALKAQAKGLAYVCLLSSDVPLQLRADAGRIRQILINLVNNAIKFTSEGEVLLRVSRAGPDRLRFVIEDTGIGISPDKQAELFERFTQVDNTITQQHGGTGLGLAISRELAALMGGSLALVRSAPGIGSAFAVEVAVVVRKERPAPPLRPPVLLVEPHPAEADGVRLLLKSAGHPVVLGTSRASLSSTPLAALISDGFPPREAAALAEELRAAGVSRLVLLCSLARSQEVLPVWADQYLTRPVKGPALRTLLEGALRNEAPATPSFRRATDQRVLVVDDNAINRLLVVALLEREGLRATEAANGLEAVQLARKVSPDLILMDVHMPVMDGLAATEALRPLEPELRVDAPIVVLSADQTEENQRRCLASGADAFCAKPLTQQRLQGLLRRWLPPGRILVVDDVPVNAMLLQRRLEQLGFESDVAVDGASGIAALAKARYHVVLMDLHMPVMDGLSAAREIRASAATWSTVPIVGVTANRRSDELPRCIEAGMNDCATKPLSLETLRALLQRWITS